SATLVSSRPVMPTRDARVAARPVDLPVILSSRRIEQNQLELCFAIRHSRALPETEAVFFSVRAATHRPRLRFQSTCSRWKITTRGGACEGKVRSGEGRDRQHARRVCSPDQIAADPFDKLRAGSAATTA